MLRERFLTLLSANKFPVLLALVGLFFILIGIVTTIAKDQGEKGVILEEGASTDDSPSVASEKKIMVDVSGSVLRPGVYKLSEGARIQDALIEAGGLSEKADRSFISKNINLAAKLSDGAKIYIPRIGEGIKSSTGTTGITGSGTVAGDVSGLININTATAAELDTLPGIGPKTAQKIIDGRPYSSIEELRTKKVVGSKVFEDIKDKVAVY